MDCNSLNRIHNRNAPTRQTPYPSDLIDPHFLSVPVGGFDWVEAFSDPDNKLRFFLIPKRTGPATWKALGPAPQNLYFRFSELPAKPEAALEFANQYGSLGLVKRHFHSKQTRVELAECWSDWSQELQHFRTCLEAWLMIQEQDRAGLQVFMRENEWLRVPTDDLIVNATVELFGRINSKLAPQRVYPEGCSRPSCEADGMVRLTPFVAYSLNFDVSNSPTTGTTPVLGRLYPTALISAVWLQLAELVTGSRSIRRCEKCRQWMDITESPRKGSKRMHQNCSLALRMARYRQKKKSNFGIKPKVS